MIEMATVDPRKPSVGETDWRDMYFSPSSPESPVGNQKKHDKIQRLHQAVMPSREKVSRQIEHGVYGDHDG